MEMKGERTIAAPIGAVWAALNDPLVLRDSIPGCEALDKQSDTEMTATVVTKIGPIKAKFAGSVTLSEMNPPIGYRISGEGRGGIAGFAKGGAVVSLEAAGEATVLRYEVSVAVGGKIAQLGARLIDSTARKLTDQFFENFDRTVSALEAAKNPEGA